MSQTVEHENARRRVRSKPPVGPTERRLYIVPPPGELGDKPTSSIWHGDANELSPEGTTLEDWPMPREFARLIAAARAAGNVELIKQLQNDRQYCADMRRKLRLAERSERNP